MYIYNVTINIAEDVHDLWLEWMKKEHIPEMMETGKFTGALMTRVLMEEEMGGITYSVQYQVKNMETLQRYYDENAARLRSKSNIFKDKAVYFRTHLEIVYQQ